VDRFFLRLRKRSTKSHNEALAFIHEVPKVLGHFGNGVKSVKTNSRAQHVMLIVLLVLVTSSACNRGPASSTAATQPSPTPAALKPIEVPSPIIGKPYPGKGVVKLINKQEGWIEIDHEEIEGLMPAMVMEWFVEKKSLLNKVKVGDKVKFTVVETGKAEIITDLERIE